MESTRIQPGHHFDGTFAGLCEYRIFAVCLFQTVSMQKQYHPSYVKLTIILVSTITIMAGATVAPALPAIREAFANNADAEFLTRLILTMPALVIALTAPFAGFLIERAGKTRVLYISLVLYGIGGTSGFFADSLYFILTGRVILGVAVAGIMTIATTLIADYYENEERNAFMGLQGAAVAFGGVIFITIGGILAEYSWRFPFLLYLFSFLVLPFSIIFLHEPGESLLRESAESQHSKAASSLPYFIFFIAFFIMLIFYMVPVQLPFLMVDYLGASYTYSAYALGLSTLVAAAGSLLYKYFKKHLTYQRIFLIVFALITAGYFFIGIAETYTLIFIAMVFNGFGVGLSIPNTNLWLLNVVPAARRGRYIGGLTMSFFLGQFLSPVLAQPLLSMVNLKELFLLTSVLLLAMTLTFLGIVIVRIRHRRNRLLHAK